MLPLLQSTQPVPSQLASDIVYVLAAVGSFIGIVLGAWALFRSGTANAKADINTMRITNQGAQQSQMRSDLTQVALKTDPKGPQ